ncbi:unnamed protein product, partial [Ectocarpus sp. 13 AM-2016]
ATRKATGTEKRRGEQQRVSSKQRTTKVVLKNEGERTDRCVRTSAQERVLRGKDEPAKDAGKVLGVDGDEKQEFRANQCVSSPLKRLELEIPCPEFFRPAYRDMVPTKFGCPVLHVAAKYCSIPALPYV